ncbi:protein transporter tim9 [Stylosanthes scabra]|uniref:Mitochondrial import inner membrane translocase subunit n=1 Tax=Stylosanthes scabra TaxID=79078 RepID=A0ABU6SNW9_9FABA|nr:protein transporter tim9 [Stylosanthes scabra]
MDKNVFSAMSDLPEEDKQRMSTIVDQLQIRDSLKMYNSLVERCFKDCVDTFYRKSLTKKEETCVLRCAEKFMRLSMQVGSRFSDIDQGA